MLAYILRRLLLVIPTLLGIMIINFAIVQATHSELLIALHRAVLDWLREQRISSIETDAIMCPPPRNGGISSSRSLRPCRMPTPVGP